VIGLFLLLFVSQSPQAIMEQAAACAPAGVDPGKSRGAK
jgi:hypothetical protein